MLPARSSDTDAHYHSCDKNASVHTYKLTGTFLSLSPSEVNSRLKRAEEMDDAVSVQRQSDDGNHPQGARGAQLLCLQLCTEFFAHLAFIFATCSLIGATTTTKKAQESKDQSKHFYGFQEGNQKQSPGPVR